MSTSPAAPTSLDNASARRPPRPSLRSRIRTAHRQYGVFVVLVVLLIGLAAVDRVAHREVLLLQDADQKVSRIGGEIRLAVERLVLARSEFHAITDDARREAIAAAIASNRAEIAERLDQFDASLAASFAQSPLYVPIVWNWAADPTKHEAFAYEPSEGATFADPAPLRDAASPARQSGLHLVIDPLIAAITADLESLTRARTVGEPGNTVAVVPLVSGAAWQEHAALALGRLQDLQTESSAATALAVAQFELYAELLTLGIVALFAFTVLFTLRRLVSLQSGHPQTEARKLATQLTEESATLESILASVPDFIFYKDTEGRYLGCNDAFGRFAGCDRSLIRGKSDYELFRSDLASAFRADDFEVIVQGVTHNIEEWVDRPDGGQMLVETIKTPIRDRDNRTLGVVGISREITDRKKYELQLEEERRRAELASRAKSDFLASMSHELRTPLNGVIGMTELLLGTRLDGQQERFVRVAKTAADALLGLINDVLDFSKIEAGKMELDRHEFHLTDMVAELAELFASRAESKGILFVLDLSTEVPDRVGGDRARLQQVLTNLLGNAVKFTSSGEVVLSVEVVRRTLTQRVIRFNVTDTGIGMNDDQVARLFESFHQGDTSTTRRFGGTGLGLAISRRIAELMGGVISVTSQPDRGSTFSLEVALDTATGHEFDPPPSAWSRLCGLRVLLVARSSSTKFALARILRSSNILVTSADTPEQAIDCVIRETSAQRPFEVIIHERSLSSANEDVAFLDRMAAASRSAEGSVPVLQVTPSLACSNGECLRAHLEACLVHPVTPRLLLEVLSHLTVPGQHTPRPAGAVESVPGHASCRCDPRAVGQSQIAGPRINAWLAAGHEPGAAPTQGALHRAISAEAGDPTSPAMRGRANMTGAERSHSSRGHTLACPQVRLLLAEDNEIGQMVAVNLLRQIGYACDVATNGAEAVKAAASNPYDLVLMDCQMPGIDGFEATRRIRAAESSGDLPAPEHGRVLSHLPIVALTASAVQGDREACLAAGMDAYLTKPIDSHRLKATIESYLPATLKRVPIGPEGPRNPWVKLTVMATQHGQDQPGAPETMTATATATATAATAAATDDRAMTACALNSGTPPRPIEAHDGPQLPFDEETIPQQPRAEMPPIDRACLLSACRGNVQLAQRIITKFGATAPNDAARMREELQQSDWSTLARSAHSLKGAAACIAAEAVRSAAAAIESAARTRASIKEESSSPGAAVSPVDKGINMAMPAHSVDNATAHADAKADTEPVASLEQIRALVDDLVREVERASGAIPGLTETLQERA